MNFDNPIATLRSYFADQDARRARTAIQAAAEAKLLTKKQISELTALAARIYNSTRREAKQYVERALVIIDEQLLVVV